MTNEEISIHLKFKIREHTRVWIMKKALRSSEETWADKTWILYFSNTAHMLVKRPLFLREQTLNWAWSPQMLTTTFVALQVWNPNGLLLLFATPPPPGSDGIDEVPIMVVEAKLLLLIMEGEDDPPPITLTLLLPWSAMKASLEILEPIFGTEESHTTVVIEYSSADDFLGKNWFSLSCLFFSRSSSVFSRTLMYLTASSTMLVLSAYTHIQINMLKSNHVIQKQYIHVLLLKENVL